MIAATGHYCKSVPWWLLLVIARRWGNTETLWASDHTHSCLSSATYNSLLASHWRLSWGVLLALSNTNYLSTVELDVLCVMGIVRPNGSKRQFINLLLNGCSAYDGTVPGWIVCTWLYTSGSKSHSQLPTNQLYTSLWLISCGSAWLICNGQSLIVSTEALVRYICSVDVTFVWSHSNVNDWI